MKIPKQNTIRGKICLILFRAPSTAKEIKTSLNKVARTTIEQTLSEMCKTGAFIREGHTYSLCDELREHYADNYPLLDTSPEVQERAACNFTPWTGKYSISAEAKRSDALPARDIYFKTATEAATVYWSET